MLKKITVATLSLFLLTSLSACSKKDETPQSSVDSSDVEDTNEENKEDSKNTKNDIELTSYQMQSVVSSINNKLSHSIKFIISQKNFQFCTTSWNV